MSIEEKQGYLKEEIIERGINPEEFFQYWQNFDLELDDVSFDKLKDIVEEFLKQVPEKQSGGSSSPSKKSNDEENQKGKEEQDEEDQFSDFQQAEVVQENAVVEEVKEVKNQNVDFNWDFLNMKKQEPLGDKSFVNPSPKKQFTSASKEKNSTKKAQSLAFSPNLIDVDEPEVKKEPKKSQPKVKNENKKIESTKKERQPLKKSQPKQNSNNSTLIQQINQGTYKQKFAQLHHPIEQKSMTVKQVLKQSKLGSLKCLKLQQNVLSHHTNVQIIITNVQQVEQKSTNLINKIMKSTSTVFTIKTVARNKNRSVGISWEVKRKTHDFQWLRNMMVKFYPGLVVPPLPHASKSKEKIFGYQKKLEHFLIDCYRCPQLKNSKYFEVFLSYNNQADFDGFIKNSLTASKPKTIGHIINMTGSIETLYSNSIDKYGSGLHNYLSRTSSHLKHVNHILNEINEAYDNISDLYKELGNVFMEMGDQSLGFSDQKCYQRLTQTYKQIAFLTAEHASFCQGEKEFIDAFMKSHFSYEKLRLENMQNLITKRNSFATQFSKRSKDEDSKGGVFSKITGLFGDKSQYVDTPSSNYETLNNQVGYYNNQLLRESIRCVEGMIESHINHFSGYGHSRIDNVDKTQKFWANQLVELSKLGLSK